MEVHCRADTGSKATGREAQVVIDAIEEALEADRFWVFPGKGTRMGAIMRRLFPGMIWKQIHQVEGW